MRHAEEIGLLPGSSEEKRTVMSFVERQEVDHAMVALEAALNIAPPVPAGGGRCVPLAIESFTVPTGAVAGAVEYDQECPTPQAAWMLPAGETMSVEAGTAIAVMTKLRDRKSTWKACELPNGGVLSGPLVWGWQQPSAPSEIVRRRARKDGSEIADRISWHGFGIAAVLSALCAYGVTESWRGMLGLSLVGIVCSFLLGLWLEDFLSKRFAREDRRRPEDLPALPDLTVELPEEMSRGGKRSGARKSDGPLPQPKEDLSTTQTHDEVRDALVRLSATWRKVDGSKPHTEGGVVARTRLNHTVGTIVKISRQIAEHPAVAEREEVRIPFLQLIASAEESLCRFEMDCDDHRSREVLADIRALAKQLEGFDDGPSEASDKSTQS